MKQARSANLTLCWKRRKCAHGLPSGGWWTNWLTKVICSLVTTTACNVKLATCTVPTDSSNFWSRTTLCPSATCGQRHPFHTKKEHQRVHSQFGLRQVWFSTVSSRLTSTPQSVWTSDLETTLHCPPVCRTCRDKFRNLVVHFLQANLLCSVSHTMCMTCGRKFAFDHPNGPRAPLQSNFDDPDGWEPTESPGDQLSFRTSVVAQTGEAHRMDPVACCPIIMCRKTGVPIRAHHLRWYMDTKLGRRQSRAKFARQLSRDTNVTLSDFDSCQNASLAISRRPSWVSWSDLPREQSALSGEDTVTGECAKPPPSENDTLGINRTNTPEEQRKQSSDEEKAALLAAASGPCAPSESKFPAVSDMSCAVSHCCGRPDILTNSSESAGRSCGKDASRVPPALYDTYQHDVFSGVELVSRATHINRKRRNWATRQRQSKAHKKAERVAKRELSTKPLSKYCESGTTLTNIFQVSYTSATDSLFCMVTTRCFSASCVVPSTLAGH